MTWAVGRPAAQVEHAERAQEARRHLLAGAGRLAFEQRREDPLEREHRRAVRRDRHRGEGRTFALEDHAELVGAAGRRADQRVVPGHVAQRMLATEAGDLTVHEARVTHAQRRPVDAEVIGGCRFEGDECHVGGFSNVGDAGAAGIGGEVDVFGAQRA